MKRTVPRVESRPALAVARGELIGLAVRVVASSDPGLVGRGGLVIDETLRTFIVRWPDGRESRLGKAGTTFEFVGPHGPVRLEGAAIQFRPQDRTKKVR